MHKRHQSGFTIIEVVITLVIMMILMLTLASMVRSTLDLREALSDVSTIKIELMQTLRVVQDDLQHAFLVSTTDLARFGDPAFRRTKTHFEIVKFGDFDELKFTAMNQSSRQKNQREADSYFVVYKVETDQNGIKVLRRGVVSRIPEGFEAKDGVVYRDIARNVKKFQIDAWRGDEWSRDRWDSTRGEWRNKIPHLVRVHIELEVSKDAKGEPEAANTVVYIAAAQGSEEPRKGSSNIRWDQL
jgi:Tfp pilus assembly protein PilE